MNIVGCDKGYNNLYQSLIKRSITENRKLEKQLRKKLTNYDKLYYETKLPFKEDRIIHIRQIKIPTFTEKDEPTYYNLFLNDISMWRKGEIREIHTQCMELLDKRQTNSYTIFQSGKLHGHFHLNENMKYYGMFIFNTNDIQDKHIDLLITTVQRNLRRKIEKVECGHVLFGNLKKDIKRMHVFIDYLDVLRPGMCIFNTNYGNVSRILLSILITISIKGGN